MRKVKKYIIVLIACLKVVVILCQPLGAEAQGLNANWLLGYANGNKINMSFSDTSYSIWTGSRKMRFSTTEGNISDRFGNLIISSNGKWIANATGDTMLNGTGLNPGAFTSSSINNDGLLLEYANVILPWPGDTTKYAMFHHTLFYDGQYYTVKELLMTVIDMTLDNGKGGVTTKNMMVLQDNLGVGIAACRHANGRDWWIAMLKDSSDFIYKGLLTTTGFSVVGSQQIPLTPYHWGNVTQLTFSPNGEKLAYTSTLAINNKWNFDVRVMDFDRCTGLFSNGQVINLVDSVPGSAFAFSPNSKYMYAASSNVIYQLNVDTTNIPASKQVVAINDTFYSAGIPTNFFHFYLAANGKIYGVSGSSVAHLHEINFPDSGGVACGVQLHNVNLGVYFFRTIPNHPNYYLGAVTGSVCDSLGVGIQELQAHDFRFSVSPNPSNGNFRMLYLLPQNQSGLLEIYDVNGRLVLALQLPPWSTLQEVELPFALTGGVYSCVLTSAGQRGVRKVVLLR